MALVTIVLQVCLRQVGHTHIPGFELDLQQDQELFLSYNSLHTVHSAEGHRIDIFP